MYKKIFLQNFRIGGAPTWCLNGKWQIDPRFANAEKVALVHDNTQIDLDGDRFEVVKTTEITNGLCVGFKVPEENGDTYHSIKIYYCL